MDATVLSGINDSHRVSRDSKAASPKLGIHGIRSHPVSVLGLQMTVAFCALQWSFFCVLVFVLTPSS